MDSFKVVLDGPAPWGFQLQRGKVPLSISRLTPGGKAAQAGVAVGDWVLSIDGENAGGLTHIEAQNKIRACGEHLSLGLSRAQPAQNKLQKALAPAADPPWYTFAPSASLNKTARPFGLAQPVGGPGENAKPLVLGPEFKHAIQASIKEFGFNMVASDMISLDRSVNDLRQEEIAGPSVQIKNQDKGLWRKIGESKWHVLPTLERHCCHFQGKSCKVFTASKCEQPTAVSCLS